MCQHNRNGQHCGSNCTGGHYKSIVEIRSIYDESTIAFRYIKYQFTMLANYFVKCMLTKYEKLGIFYVLKEL